MMVKVTPEPVDSLVPAGLAGAGGSTNSMQLLVRQVASEDDLSIEEEVVDFCVSSPADLAGGVTFGVAPSADAEVASSANLAEVASSADIAEVALSADIAEVAS